jgi:hypothetical protein
MGNTAIALWLKGFSDHNQTTAKSLESGFESLTLRRKCVAPERDFKIAGDFVAHRLPKIATFATLAQVHISDCVELSGFFDRVRDIVLFRVA